MYKHTVVFHGTVKSEAAFGNYGWSFSVALTGFRKIYIY